MPDEILFWPYLNSAPYCQISSYGSTDSKENIMDTGDDYLVANITYSCFHHQCP